MKMVLFTTFVMASYQRKIKGNTYLNLIYQSWVLWFGKISCLAADK